MKKILILLLVLLSYSSYSQTGFKHINIHYGLTYEKASNIEISLDFNRQYFNAWTIFISHYAINKNKSGDLENTTLGFYYSSNLIASKNNFLNLKMGSSGGSNGNNFIIDAILGLEYNYAISRNIKFSLFFKNNIMFNSNPLVRHALLGGLKFRL
ncbi:hypothetical protein [Tenacibaculum finnmarkense]|uniref:hypothetical protein n=1 Tax=Tenacibaculum finnmarkense TaxID=2781243 RepID=UPI001EFBE02C|nr:hypothetical protein [Tenacibaculum finnmarkense]MCG8226375.1 hypothetical protein [Tenacibaculum finnmarkense genomovar finnmarkense]